MKEQRKPEGRKFQNKGGALSRTGEAGLEGRAHWHPALWMGKLRTTGDKETPTLSKGLAQAHARLRDKLQQKSCVWGESCFHLRSVLVQPPTSCARGRSL